MGMLTALLFFIQADSLKAVEARLRTDLARVSGVMFSHDGDVLVVKYRAEKKLAAKQRKARIVKAEQEVVERPAQTGFILNVYEFDHRPDEGARPMQAIRVNPNWVRDYGGWKLDADDRQVVGASRARYYNFEWGAQANAELVARIRKAFEYGTRHLDR